MTRRIEHGTDYRYQKGCRCDLCRKVHNRNSARYQRKWLQKERCHPGLGWPLGPGDIAPRRPPKRSMTRNGDST